MGRLRLNDAGGQDAEASRLDKRVSTPTPDEEIFRVWKIAEGGSSQNFSGSGVLIYLIVVCLDRTTSDHDVPIRIPVSTRGLRSGARRELDLLQPDPTGIPP